ncbi:MAG: glucose-6-phosphate dehydrogenase assembly protein OpcA [Verrucomicrobia bacterium]|nr:glucose-6-phosphate dehydrogenase assembly protein OpcA [Verrucomicrobiota bacterium]
MGAVFQALPGLEVPVGAIGRSLAQMWTESAAGGRPAPEADDARATQVNFVLHLGLNSTPEDALEQFATVVRFSRRYPGRVVVLCPLHEDVPQPEIRAKIYGECFLGKSRSDKRCVEFVMLSYSRSARRHLENQVSICLSTDLPLYYWAHRFSASGRLADYRYLLSQAKRVLLDSAIAPADALAYPWPNPAATRDLVHCRLLPFRQSLGQFLAAYRREILIDGLREVTVTHGTALTAEARVALGWLEARLTDCGLRAGQTVFRHTPAAEDEPVSHLGVAMTYEESARYFRWRGDVRSGQALFEADLGAGRTTLSAGISLLSPENALSEAMFF